MKELPIHAIHQATKNALQQPKPIVVIAPTGSGKSTCLPLWMAEHGGPVLVVEPRRVACRSLASYLAEQRGEKVGASIGYRIRFEDRSSPQTRVLFVTPGIVLRMLRHQTDAWPYRAVMIDEFHERGWETDLALMLLRQRRTQGRWQGPLLLTSATLDGESLAKTLDALVLRSEGRTYPVDTSYTEDPAAPTSQHLAERVAAALAQHLRPNSDGDLGDTLVFLPGKGEIERCAQSLAGLAVSRDLVLTPVHGSLPTDRVVHALRQRPDGKARIFLATNIAETSLTLPGVTLVIDSGLVRQRLHRAGRSILAMAPISRAAMDQRAGRAGRVAPGRCVRLWSQRFRPDETTAPAIERIELDDVVLAAAACGVTSRAQPKAPWLTPPPDFALDAAESRLQDIGALDQQGEITDQGRALFRLPVQIHEARMLLHAPPELAGTVADLVALLQLRGPLLLPTAFLGEDKREQIREARTVLLQGAKNEVYVQLKTLRRGHPKQHHLHSTGLQEARRMARSLRELVKVKPTQATQDIQPLPDPVKLAKALLHAWPESGFVLRPRAQKTHSPKKRQRSGPIAQPWANGQDELMVTPYTLPYEHTQDNKKATAGLILDHEWVGDLGTSFRGYGRMLLPCRPALLAEVGLGEESYEAPKLHKSSNGDLRITASLQRTLANVVLDTKDAPLHKTSLHHATANFVMEGRVFKGVREELEERLHLWKILLSWPEPEGWRINPEKRDDFPDCQQYLCERLAEHGVESSGDLALLEDEDLLPDLSQELGCPDYVLEEWRTDFPRYWRYQGATFVCDVKSHARRVTLSPHDKAARKAPPPPKTVLPRFRGFSVDYQKASRRLKLR